MAITVITQQRDGPFIRVTATSDLTPAADVRFHWYLDGSWFGDTADGRITVVLEAEDEQAELHVIDTTDPDFDPVANAPAMHPARREVYWVRADDPQLVGYRVQQVGPQTEFIADVPQDPSRWQYAVRTPVLTDGESYLWRVHKIDNADNIDQISGTNPEKIVRTPDAPEFGVTLDAASPPHAIITEAA